MKQAGTIINQASQTKAKQALTDAQKDSVTYFFMRLKLTYANQYSVNMPDETTEKFTKHEYARQVSDLTRQQISNGFDLLHDMRQTNPQKWRYMDIDQTIGLIKNKGVQGAARPPNIENTRKMLKGVEHKRTEEEINLMVSKLAALRVMNAEEREDLLAKLT